MPKPILATDVDFVLLDWVAGLEPFLKEKGMRHDHIPNYSGSTYYPSLQELFDIKDENKNLEILAEFNKSIHIENLPIFQKEAVEHLRNIQQEYDIVAITCLGTEQDQKEKRTQNLVNHYGDVFDEVVCIPVRTSKQAYLEELMKERHVEFFVDDRIKHLQEAIDANIKPLLYVRNADRPDTDIPIVECWSHVEQKLNKLHLKRQQKQTRGMKLR